jgi:hypothetical protein
MSVEPHEIAAAQAVKLCKMLILEAEADSIPDKWKALKLKVAKFDQIADMILGNAPYAILRDWPPD